MEEQVFLQEGGMFVSISRVILAGTTYSTANITSVSKRVRPARTGCAVALIVLGVLFLFAGLAGFSEGAAMGFGGLFWAALILTAGIAWYRSLKPTYLVIFASASGESEAMSSKDQGLIDRVVGSVNEAIVARG